jgi:hypothetical protein
MVQACGLRGPAGISAGRSAVIPTSRTFWASPTAYQRALISNANVRMARVRPAGIRRMQTV